MTSSLPYANNIPLPGFFNLRDGGDLPTPNGKVRADRLLRSDEPSSLNEQALTFLKGLPLNLVIDLRTEQEIEMSQDPFAESGFKVDTIPVFSGSVQSMMGKASSLEALYVEMIDGSAAALASAVGAVSDGVQDGAVIVHCTAGKDRTGVVIALTQSLLGAPEQEIVDNYSATQANLNAAWFQETMKAYATKMGMTPDKIQAMVAKTGVPLADLEKIATSSPASAMQGVLQHLDTKYGGAKKYLLSNGLPQAKIDALVSALLVAN